MNLGELARLLEEISSAPVMEKRDLLDSLLSSVPIEILPEVSAIVVGEGVAGRSQIVKKTVIEMVLSQLCGTSSRQLRAQLRISGDLGETAYALFNKSKQTALLETRGNPLRTVEVFEELRALRVQKNDSKVLTMRLKKLLAQAASHEARLIVRALVPSGRPHAPRPLVVSLLSKRLGIDEKEVESTLDREGIRDGVASLLAAGST